MTKLYLGIHLNNNHFTSIIDALKKTLKYGGNVLQIYMGDKNLTTLREKIKLNKDEIKEIKSFIKINNIKLFIHAILRLNYCYDPFSKRYQWGLDNLIYDMNMCNKLGGCGVVIHMGTHKTPKINISYDECIKNFIDSLTIVLNKSKKIPILLETPVNRKNIVGGTLEGMALLYNKIPNEYKKRVKICVDTQHIFVSGYNFRNVNIIKDYFDNFDKLIGIKNLLLIHLNDSQKEFDSLVNRHAPIGKGFIFSNHKDSLVYLINFGKKHHISFVLETNYEFFKYEINFLKSLVYKNGGVKKDIKEDILKIFNEILFFHESLGKKGNISTQYRIDSYRKAIKSLEKFDKPIYSCEEVKDLEYIGKGFCNKIDEISKTGTLKIYENIKKNNHLNSYKLFQDIWGIGPELSRRLVNKKIYNIQNLKNAIKNKKITLTNQQMIGLKYYDDLKEKINRDEIKYYTDEIKNLMETNEIKVYNAGSYRGGKEKSGDIDLIISFQPKLIKIQDINKDFYNKLLKNNIIKETLSSGNNKCIYIVKLKGYKYFRKLDVAFVENEKIPFYLLYFGSSRDFSKKIRAIASKMGYKLNEKGLFYKNGKRVNFNPKSEEEIFDFLKIDYVKPENRI
jgi:apurinic endonuclease APN1